MSFWLNNIWGIFLCGWIFGSIPSQPYLFSKNEQRHRLAVLDYQSVLNFIRNSTCTETSSLVSDLGERSRTGFERISIRAKNLAPDRVLSLSRSSAPCTFSRTIPDIQDNRPDPVILQLSESPSGSKIWRIRKNLEIFYYRKDEDFFFSPNIKFGAILNGFPSG